MVRLFNEKGPQSRRVLAVGASDPMAVLPLFDASPPWDVITAERFNGTNLDEYDVVILLRPELAKTYSALLSENTSTPVLLVDDGSGPPQERQLSASIVYAVVTRDEVEAAVERAMEARNVLLAYGILNPKAREILQALDKPRFSGALEVAILEAQQHLNLQRFFGSREGFANSVWQTRILPGLQEYTRADIEHRATVGAGLASELALFLDAYRAPGLERVVLNMQEPGVGECSVARVHDSKGGWTIKNLLPKRGLTAKQLAKQLSRDVKSMKNTGFKFPLLLEPFCFEDYPVDRNDALVTMEHIRGASLRQVLDVLNKGYKGSTHDADTRARIHHLRTEFVRTFLDDCVLWQKNAPPLLARGSFVLSDGTNVQSIGEYYEARINNMPEVFSRMTFVEFNDSDAALYRRAIQIFRQIDSSEPNLTRGRDAKYLNAVVKLPWEDFNSSQLLKHFFEGDSLEASVRNSLYNIDPKLYRLEHALEPLTRVLTCMSSKFMLFDLQSDGAPGNQLSADRTLRRILEERDEYVRKLGRPNLEHNDSELILLLVYRSLRELHSRASQWERTRSAAPDMFPSLYDSRKNSIVAQMRHQYVLLQNLLKVANTLFGRQEIVQPAFETLRYHRDELRSDDPAKLYASLFDQCAGNPATHSVIAISALQYVIGKIQTAYIRCKRPVNFLRNGV